VNRRPSRLSIRSRLTLVYGGLFLVAGVVLLALTYVLVTASLMADPPSAPRSIGAPEDGPPDTERPVLPEVVRQVREDALSELLTQGGIALAMVGVTAIGLGWLVAGRMVQPLHRITSTARRIAHAPAADRRLGERIALEGPRDELKDLADTFDLMLERLDHSFDGQRRFIANASHELRTPLTLNRTLIEVALEPEDVPEETRRLGATLLAVNAQHERLIEGLLMLARSERDLHGPAYVDLADVAEHAAGVVRQGTVTIRTELAEAPTTGDALLLERLMRNLIDNGVKYNMAEHGWVHVSTGTRPDGTVALQVANSGPHVSPYEVSRLFEPFHRLNGDLPSVPGTGLGLSIVRAVVHAHHGDVHAEPRDEGGLTVTVTLPAST
jgi:signal transduction histidine kinase